MTHFSYFNSVIMFPRKCNFWKDKRCLILKRAILPLMGTILRLIGTILRLMGTILRLMRTILRLMGTMLRLWWEPYCAWFGPLHSMTCHSTAPREYITEKECFVIKPSVSALLDCYKNTRSLSKSQERASPFQTPRTISPRKATQRTRSFLNFFVGFEMRVSTFQNHCVFISCSAKPSRDSNSRWFKFNWILIQVKQNSLYDWR